MEKTLDKFIVYSGLTAGVSTFAIALSFPHIPKKNYEIPWIFVYIFGGSVASLFLIDLKSLEDQ